MEIQLVTRGRAAFLGILALAAQTRADVQWSAPLDRQIPNPSRHDGTLTVVDAASGDALWKNEVSGRIVGVYVDNGGLLVITGRPSATGGG